MPASASAPAPANPVPVPRALHGPGRAAVVLLAMGKSAASRLLTRFDAAELKEIARAASTLGTVSPGDLETIIEEFASEFSEGMSLHGTADEVEKLLTGVLPGEQISDIMSDVLGQKQSTSAVWDRASQTAEGPMADFLANEHPQVAALILAKMQAETSAKILAHMPEDFRNDLMRRLTSLRPVTPSALRLLESSMHEALLTTLSRNASSDTYGRVADILNRLEPDQADGILAALEKERPDVVKALKRLIFRFDDISKLAQKARSKVFDQVPAEQVVLALRGCDAELTELILSSIASRARRMVEHELQSGDEVDPRAVNEARRAIADRIMDMISRGEIELNASENEDG